MAGDLSWLMEGVEVERGEGSTTIKVKDRDGDVFGEVRFVHLESVEVDVFPDQLAGMGSYEAFALSEALRLASVAVGHGLDEGSKVARDLPVCRWCNGSGVLPQVDVTTFGAPMGFDGESQPPVYVGGGPCDACEGKGRPVPSEAPGSP